MQFVFDERTAAQAVAHLLRRHGGPMPSARLARLLYLADRRGFTEVEYPITGDRFVAVPDGPTLARIPDLIEGVWHDADSRWSAFVSPAPNACVTAVGLRDEDHLSEYDRDTLDTVLDEFGAMDDEALAAHLRALPEWTAPAGPCDIDPRVILRDAGFTEDAIADVESNVADIHWLRTKYGADSSL